MAPRNPPRAPARAAAASVRPLVALMEQALRGRLSAQAATVFVWLGGFVASALLAVVARTDDPRAGDPTLESALGFLSWVAAGGVLLAATSEPSADDLAVQELAVLRGFPPGALERAHWLATGRRVVFMLLPWTLVMSAVLAWHVRSPGAALGHAVVSLGCLAYLALLGGCCVLLVAAARALSPERPRLVLASVVFLPVLFASVFPQVPTVPALLDGILHAAISFGRSVG